MLEQWRIIYERVASNPASVRGFFTSLHSDGEKLEDHLLDELFGIPIFRYGIEPREIDKEEELRSRYGDERLLYVGTPYRYIRHAIHGLNPQQGDVVYDLGSGYGRVPLYGALVTEAHYKGVEVLPSRVDVAQRAKEKYDIKNVEFLQANVRNVDFSDGTMFYLYNPFNEATHYHVSERLYALAQQKTIRIAFLESQEMPSGVNWLRKIYDGDRLVKVYESRQ